MDLLRRLEPHRGGHGATFAAWYFLSICLQQRRSWSADRDV